MNEIPGAVYPRVFDLAGIAAIQEKTLTMKLDPAMERLAELLVVNGFRIERCMFYLRDRHQPWR